MPPKLAKRIQTLVFLDFETTGLPNDAPIRATELSMLAIDRGQFENTAKSFSLHTPRLPRVQNKLTLCFNPHRNIHYKASEMTGLCNENTKNQPPFDPLASSLIKAFVGLFPKPLCLIAHNGRRFDFPLLVSETSDPDHDWGEDIYCADSMAAIRELEHYVYSSIEIETNQVFVKSTGSLGSSNPTITKRTCSAPTSTSPVQPSMRKLRSSCESKVGCSPLMAPSSVVTDVTVNDLQSCSRSNLLAPSDTEQSIGLITETHLTEKLLETIVQNNGLTELVVQESVEIEQTSLTMIKSQTVETTAQDRKKSQSNAVIAKKFGSVSLPKVYERLFGRVPDGSHGAEDDVISMALCCLAVKEPFLEWVDENATLIRDVKGFW